MDFEKIAGRKELHQNVADLDLKTRKIENHGYVPYKSSELHNLPDFLESS